MSSRSQGDPIEYDEGEISSSRRDHDTTIGIVSETEKVLDDLPDAKNAFDSGNKNASTAFKDTLEDKPRYGVSSSCSKALNEDADESEIGSGAQTTIKNTPAKDNAGVNPEEIIDSPNDNSVELCPSLADTEKDSSSIGEELVVRWDEDDNDEIDDSLQLSPKDKVLRKLNRDLGLDVESENRDKIENQCNTDKLMETVTVAESLAGISPNKKEDNGKNPNLIREDTDYETGKKKTQMLLDPVETQSIIQNTDSTEQLDDVEMAPSTSFEKNKKIIDEINELTKDLTDVKKTFDDIDDSIPENIVKPEQVDIIIKVNAEAEVFKDISKQLNSIKHVTSGEIQTIASPIVAIDVDIDKHLEVINQETKQDLLLHIDSGTTKITLPNEPETSNAIEKYVDESVKKDILEQIDEFLDTTKKTKQTTSVTSPEPNHKNASNVETVIYLENNKPDGSHKSGTKVTTKPDNTDINEVSINSESIKLKTDLARNGDITEVKDKNVTLQEIPNSDKMENISNESITDKRHIDDIDLSQLNDSLLETTINPNIHHRITKPNIMLDIPTQDLSDIEAELDDSDLEFKEIGNENPQNNVTSTSVSNTKETFIDSVITQNEVAIATSPSSDLSLSTETETSKLFKIDNDQSNSEKTPTSKDYIVDEKTSLLKSVQVTDVEKTSSTDLNQKSGVETLGQIDVLKPSIPKAMEIDEHPTKLEINEISTKSTSDIDEIQSTSNSKQNDNDESPSSRANIKNDICISITSKDTTDVPSVLNKNINEFTLNKELHEELSIMKEAAKSPSSLKEVDQSQSIMKETNDMFTKKYSETSSLVKGSDEMPTTSNIEDVNLCTKKNNEDEVPSSSKKMLDEASSKNTELDKMSSTSMKDINEVPSTSKKDINEVPSTSKKDINEVPSTSKKDMNEVPSTSKKDINEVPSTSKKYIDEVPSSSKVDELSLDNADEVHEITDSLGLLAESFRVMDDDEDDADDNEDDEDFDLYEEASNQMAEDLDSNSPTPGVELKDTVEPSPRPQESDEGTMDVVDDIEYVENELPDDVVSDAPSNEENVEKEEPEIIDADEHIAIPPPEKIITILEKVLGNQDVKKEPATNSSNVLNYVEIEGSSDSDDVQEVSKSDAVKDGVVSVNIPKAVEVMSTSAGITSEILVKGDEVVISGVPKPYTPKKTTINTSEVTIKSKPTSTPAIEIPEKTEIESKAPEDEESINLDSDEEETDKQKEVETPIVAEKEDKTKELIDKKCLNPDCTNESTVYYDAPRSTAAFYSLSRRGVVCELCKRRVSKRDEGLIQGIKDLRPLLGLETDAPSQQLVEISDSDSEDDGDPSDEAVGDVEAKFLEEQLADMMNSTWTKYNLDARLKETEAYLMKELEEIEAGAKEIDSILNDCQKSTDDIRVDFYKNYEPRRSSVGSILIHDTPFSSYSMNEKDEDEKPTLTQGRYPKRKSSTCFSDTPAKKAAFLQGCVPLDNKMVSGDHKIDDDKEDIKVVKLSAEAAPADLPPCGEVVWAPIKVGMTTYAMRNAFGTWLKGKVQDILPKSSGQTFTQCRVKFEHKVKNPCKLLSARCIAYPEPCEVRMTIGARVIAMFKDQENKSRQDSFTSGVVAEIPNPVNNYRYLVFFDHGYAQYVHHRDTRLVCESSPRVWEEVHPFISEFICKYIVAYPERPMVRLHTGEKLKTEWNGKWWDSQVMQVDASLALIHFEEDNRSEWIYRGSTRLAPLFLELEAAQKAGGRGRSRLPRSKAQMRSNMPCVEYTREDAEITRPNESQETNEQELRRLRSVAKKSTTQAAPASHDIPGTPFEGIVSRVVYYTPKNAVKPHKLVPHICTIKCRRADVLSLKDLRTYNPLAKPLLSGWERQTVRFRGQKEVMYRAPCGRRLRNMEELHKYLRTLQSDLSVDLFDFTAGTHCLAEFVLNKCIVMKKDLSHGKENVPVPCVNYYDDTLPEFCSYNTERTPTAGVPLNLDTDFLCGCDCTDDCRDKTKCACWKMTLEGARTIGLEGPNIGYSYRRLPEPLPSGIYECNSRCRCKQTCLNRVAQHPLQLKLQVFKTSNRGWGIRALNDVPKGAFICIYAGNLLTDATANLDGLNEGDEYLAELDYIEVVEGMKEGYEDDVPDKDKKLDKKPGASDSDCESSSESEEEQDKTEDGDFQPGYIPQPKGQVYFKKSLRKREKAKKMEEKAKQEEMKKRCDTITISDDEEVREPSRFTAEAGMGNISKNSSRVSVRTLFGKDEACYIMDAKVQGNIGRYLNHSCHPNVFVQNVFVDTHDPRFPWVAFFSLAYVRAGTELTWNYNYDIGSVPDKVLYCYCGAPNCRGRLL